MPILIKIALRNVLKNKKRTLLIGMTLFISCTLLLFCFSISNGLGYQILKNFRITQSGDVVVVWKNVKTIDVSDPSRLYFSEFDIKRDKENQIAIKRLDAFLAENRKDIALSINTVKKSGMLDTQSYASFCTIYGLTQEELDFYMKEDILRLTSGKQPLSDNYGVCISEVMAQKNNIRLGEWIILDCETVSGMVNTLEYRVTGFFESTSDYDSVNVYMSRENALELFDQPEEYFQSVRIYLKDPKLSGQFAARLDEWLMEKAELLRAEPIEYSAQFYTTISGFIRTIFILFIALILLIIAVGLRSAIRMNLFERMKEFGTLRAVGYSRLGNGAIIFFEIMILSIVCFMAAALLNVTLMLLLSNTGIPIGKGAISYVLGGTVLYPIMTLQDTLLSLGIMAVFSLFAPLKPGLQLVHQRITHLLSQNQQPGSVILHLFKRQPFLNSYRQTYHKAR